MKYNFIKRGITNNDELAKVIWGEGSGYRRIIGDTGEGKSTMLMKIAKEALLEDKCVLVLSQTITKSDVYSLCDCEDNKESFNSRNLVICRDINTLQDMLGTVIYSGGYDCVLVDDLMTYKNDVSYTGQLSTMKELYEITNGVLDSYARQVSKLIVAACQSNPEDSYSTQGKTNLFTKQTEPEMVEESEIVYSYLVVYSSIGAQGNVELHRKSPIKTYKDIEEITVVIRDKYNLGKIVITNIIALPIK